MPLPDASYDLVVFHTTLCHIPDPETALREAHRVLRPNGWLAIFDGDYTTTTVAISDFDPLQPLVNAMVANFVHNPGWRDGADILSGSASLSAEAADALRNEARRRARAGEFFGHISFVSVIARKLSDVAPGNPAQPMSRVGARGQ
jgi:SAM-dependent methyltransferase